MSSITMQVVAWLGLALAGSSASAAVAQSGGTAESFEVELQAARESTQAGSWRKAQRAWQALLGAHAGQAYALPRVQEMRLELMRATFWSRTSEPRLDEFISGKLQTHERASGRIQVLYLPDTLGDFTLSEQADQTLYTHPAHFAGPWSLQVKGTPEQVSSGAWLFTQGERGVGLRVGLSLEGALTYTFHQAWAFGPDGQRELERVKPSETKDSARSLEFDVRVGERELELRVNGRKVFAVPRGGEDFGSLTWTATSLPERLTIAGLADRGWLDGVRDAAVAEQWGAFEAEWVDPPEFALWESQAQPARDEIGLAELMAGARFEMSFKEHQKKNFEQLEPYLGKGREQSLFILEQATRLPDGALPPEAAAYLSFLSAFDLGRYQQALEFRAALRPDRGTDLELGLLYSIVLERADRQQEAQQLLEALLLEHAEQPAVHARLIEVLLARSQHAAAREVLRTSRAALPHSAVLALRESQVTQAEVGPPWKRVHEFEGRYFVVRSEVSPKLSRQAAEVLDATMARCIETLGPLPEGSERSLALVFSGELGYLDYVRGVADQSHESTLGIYSPLLAQVAVWNQPDAAGLWDVLRHECVHRYLHLRLGTVPRWLHEGLAESLAAEAQADGSWRAGTLRPDWIRLLRQAGGNVHSLQTFAYREDEFSADMERNYALAWAWLHFLRYVDEEGRAVFADLWAGMVAGMDCSQALDAALQERDAKALQARFVEFLNALIAG